MTEPQALMETFSQALKQETTWGWHQYADGAVDIHIVPGHHHTMMSEPSVQVLAEKLQEAIHKQT